MTNDQPATRIEFKIRPAGPLWIACFVVGTACLAEGADVLRNERPWFALLWLTPGCFTAAVALALRNFGVDLTPEFAIIRNLRPRRVPWREVQAVSSREDSGFSSLLLTFESREPETLIYPGPVGPKGDTRCERDLELISQWWVAHRGGSWRSVSPEAPPPLNIIPGARVLLRELTAAEVASLLDERTVRDGWAADYPFEGSRAAARGFQARSAEQHHDTPGFGMYQIVRIADGLVIGDIGFYAPPQVGSVEVGFGLVPSARGAGHGSEALRLLVVWTAQQAQVRQVVARTQADNEPSKAVLVHAGFTVVGTEGDLLRYSWTR